jgi:hypothetical protein
MLRRSSSFSFLRLSFHRFNSMVSARIFSCGVGPLGTVTPASSLLSLNVIFPSSCSFSACLIRPPLESETS